MEPEARATHISKNLCDAMSERKMNDPALRRVSHVDHRKGCLVTMEQCHVTMGGGVVTCHVTMGVGIM